MGYSPEACIRQSSRCGAPGWSKTMKNWSIVLGDFVLYWYIVRGDLHCCTAAVNSSCCAGQGRGEPPVCSNINPAGPPSPKADAHLPTVCGSRSRASAVAAAVNP